MQRGELDEATAPDVVLSAEFAGTRYQWHGKLARTEAEIDLRSRMVHAVARVSAAENAARDPDYVPPPVGLFVNAEIQGRSTEDIVILPRSAIRNGNQVLVVDDDSRLRLRTINIARIYGEDAYIDGGLAHGDLVCISVLQAVVDGMRVQVVTDDGTGAPGVPGS